MTSIQTQKRVAILVEQKFEDSEFQIPYKGLKQAGAEISVLGSRMNEKYQGKEGQVSIKPDGTFTEARPEDFDAVVIPGGMAPDTMRTNPNAVQFVQKAMSLGKLVAAVCHGPQMLIEGDLLRGKNATGFVAVRKDMINAGANYQDKPLVVDGNLITSRQPSDLAIFTTAIITRLGLDIPDQTLPDETNSTAPWWQLAEAWGGNSKKEIVDALNTALAGERYGKKAFEEYAERASDAELRSLLHELISNKQRHIQLLESRLQELDASESLSASTADAYATLKDLLHSSDDVSILRRALGDTQTGVVDTFNLRKQYTDPASAAIFTEIEKDLAASEQQLAKLYHTHFGSQASKPAKPTTGAAVSG